MGTLIWNRVPATVGAPATCNPACSGNYPVKPYLYQVGGGDDGEFYIAQRFIPGVEGKEKCDGGWGLLVAVNVPPRSTYRNPTITNADGTQIHFPCQFAFNQGNLIKIPAAWPDPVPGSTGAARLVCENGQPYPGCGASTGTTKAGMGAGTVIALVIAGVVATALALKGRGAAPAAG